MYVQTCVWCLYVHPCPHICIHTSVHVSECLYVCRITCRICVYTCMSIETWHRNVYMRVYSHIRIQTSPHPQRHEGRLTLCRALPVCQQVALSVPQGYHTANALFLWEFSCDAQSLCSRKVIPSTWVSLNLPLHYRHISPQLLCRQTGTEVWGSEEPLRVTVTMFALSSQGNSMCSPLHSPDCSVPQFMAEHVR